MFQWGVHSFPIGIKRNHNWMTDKYFLHVFCFHGTCVGEKTGRWKTIDCLASADWSWPHSVSSAVQQSMRRRWLIGTKTHPAGNEGKNGKQRSAKCVHKNDQKWSFQKISYTSLHDWRCLHDSFPNETYLHFRHRNPTQFLGHIKSNALSQCEEGVFWT